MNLGSKKAIIRAYRIILNIVLIMGILSIFTILYFYFDFLHPYKEYFPEDMFETYFLPSVLYFLIFTLYYSLVTTYLGKKFYQNKQQFFSQLVPLRGISIISLAFTPISGILLIIASFRKDDGCDELPQYKKPKKEKKKKPKYPREVKRQLRKVKHDKKLGYISKELYEKQCEEIIKNYNKNTQKSENNA